MLTTSRYGMQYPNPDRSDSADVPRDFGAVAAAIEQSAMFAQGTLASRPAAGKTGRFYMATDLSPHVLYYDTGSIWDTIGTGAGSINQSGTLAARPSAASVSAGTRFFATDQVTDYMSDGAAWIRLGIPAGFCGNWFKPDAAAPTGWVKFDGSNLPSSTGIYADVYVHLGSTLVTPDTRGRTLVGVGTHADVATPGLTDGLPVGSRRSKHKSSVVQPTINITDPQHHHGVNKTSNANEGGGNSVVVLKDGSTEASFDPGNLFMYGASTGITAAAVNGTVGPQTGAEPTDTPAYITCVKIAKL